MVAWGFNVYGQLGNNSTTTSKVPVAVTTSGVLSGKSIVAISAGSLHSLALCSDGTVAAWGSNGFGVLGNNSTTDSPVPVAVTAGPLSSSALSGKTVTAISAGTQLSLALCSDGTVASWGYISFSGNGSASPIPVAVTMTGVLLGKTVASISAGCNFSLALCTDATPISWGLNTHGVLGNNSTTLSDTPVPVSTSFLAPGECYIAISPGALAQHGLSLVATPPPQAYASTRVLAWGANANGELGNNSTTEVPCRSPVTATGALSGKSVIALSRGNEFSLALCSDGTVAAWGVNFSGQLGNNSTTDSHVPWR